MITEIIRILSEGRSMTMEQASEAMDAIMEGHVTQAQMAAFLTALRLKVETPEEIAGMAMTMRAKSCTVDIAGPIVDTCGTGGTGLDTLNISTAVAFVAAASGLTVAKHGNRAATGSCGSADVLEALGVNINIGPELVRRSIQSLGIGFMFAPMFHPAMKYAAPVRREIGIRTVFNILGPLTNPAGARFQLLGVADATLGEKIAKVLRLMGSVRSLVVHGQDGLDEITLSGKTDLWELQDGDISSYSIEPHELGLPVVPLEAIQGGTPNGNASLLRRILEGEDGPYRHVVMVNSAAILMVGGKVKTLADGLTTAAQLIDNGQALLKLENLVEFSQSNAGG